MRIDKEMLGGYEPSNFNAVARLIREFWTGSTLLLAPMLSLSLPLQLLLELGKMLLFMGGPWFLVINPQLSRLDGMPLLLTLGELVLVPSKRLDLDMELTMHLPILGQLLLVVLLLNHNGGSRYRSRVYVVGLIDENKALKRADHHARFLSEPYGEPGSIQCVSCKGKGGEGTAASVEVAAAGFGSRCSLLSY